MWFRFEFGFEFTVGPGAKFGFGSRCGIGSTVRSRWSAKHVVLSRSCLCGITFHLFTCWNSYLVSGQFGRFLYKHFGSLVQHALVVINTPVPVSLDTSW